MKARGSSKQGGEHGQGDVEKYRHSAAWYETRRVIYVAVRQGVANSRSRKLLDSKQIKYSSGRVPFAILMATLETPYEWTAHPLREHPWKAALAVVLVLFCGILVGVIVADPVFGPLAAGGAIVFLFVALNRFFLPSKYRMDEHGVAVRYPLRSRTLRWGEIRRFAHDNQGGYVSPRRRGGALDTGGISLLFGRHGHQIIPLIEAALDPTGNLSRCEIGGCDTENAQVVAGQTDNSHARSDA